MQCGTGVGGAPGQGRSVIVNVRGRSDPILSDYAEFADQTAGSGASRPSWADRRLERDRIRGYSINIKQVVLAFAIEFVITARGRLRGALLCRQGMP
jgi:hypothetical protein